MTPSVDLPTYYYYPLVVLPFSSQHSHAPTHSFIAYSSSLPAPSPFVLSHLVNSTFFFLLPCVFLGSFLLTYSPCQLHSQQLKKAYSATTFPLVPSLQQLFNQYCIWVPHLCWLRFQSSLCYYIASYVQVCSYVLEFDNNHRSLPCSWIFLTILPLFCSQFLPFFLPSFLFLSYFIYFTFKFSAPFNNHCLYIFLQDQWIFAFRKRKVQCFIYFILFFVFTLT